MHPKLNKIREDLMRNALTESDIHILLLHARKKCGPFITEIGDLIAHPDKERGEIFDRILFNYAQYEIRRYIHLRPTGSPGPIQENGKCAWWLKHYLMYGINVHESYLRRKLKLSKKTMLSVIDIHFPKRDKYPEKIYLPLTTTIAEIMELISQFLDSNGPYSERQIMKGIERVLNFLGVAAKKKIRNELLACMMVCIHNGIFSLPKDLKFRIRMFVTNEELNNVRGRKVLDGKIGLMSIVFNKDDSSFPSIGFHFFESSLKAADYLPDEMLEEGVDGIYRYKLDRDLHFMATAPNIVGTAPFTHPSSEPK